MMARRAHRWMPSIILYFLVLTTPSGIVAAQDVRSNWTLDGSQVYLLASGSDREFQIG